jgi:uncharacterized membrane protein YidH (DUF202 family)
LLDCLLLPSTANLGAPSVLRFLPVQSGTLALKGLFANALPRNLGNPENPLDLFLSRPLYAPLLFPNISSDARDHCANERTFLSWLRLAVYLAVVSVAILINFHLKHKTTELEERLSHPLGLIFFVLSLACLASGFANYIRTIAKYARRQALVQTGAKTQMIFGVVATSIVAACAVFLGAEVQARSINAL